jgi:hypothetical protein
MLGLKVTVAIEPSAGSVKLKRKVWAARHKSPDPRLLIAIAFICEWSIIMPPSTTLWPGILWPPLRTAISRSCSRANATAAATSWPARQDVPPDAVGGEIDGSESVALFVERARHLQGELALTPLNRAAIAEICRLLEGIPLALELATTWVRTLSCAEIAAEIGRSLDFLSLADHDQPATHGSMRAVFERSWSLLTADQQQVLARLSLFRGGCTREAAAFVAGASLPPIGALIQKLLVRRVADRYDLHEVIRRFGAEKLAVMPDAEVMQRRFVEYYLALSVQASQQFADYDQRDLFDALAPGLDNLRAIMQQAHRSSRPVRCAETRPQT